MKAPDEVEAQGYLSPSARGQHAGRLLATALWEPDGQRYLACQRAVLRKSGCSRDRRSIVVGWRLTRLVSQLTRSRNSGSSTKTAPRKKLAS